jgi:ABC-type glycerol-3-phosphate transport system permease component
VQEGEPEGEEVEGEEEADRRLRLPRSAVPQEDEDQFQKDWGALMAGSAIAVLPLLIIFIFSSRRLIAGLTAGAVRG